MNKRLVLSVGVFIFLLLVFFWKVVLLRQVFFCCDNVFITLPVKTFFQEELRNGRFVLWNPYIFSGMTYAGDINVFPFYAVNIFFSLFDVVRAITLSIVFHLVIAGLSIFAFMRLHNVRILSCLIAAVVYTFSGSLTVYMNNVPLLYSASLIPLAVFSLEYYIQKKTIGRYMFLLFILTSQVYSGHPQITVYSWLFFAAYGCAREKNIREAVKLFSLLVVCVFGLSALQILPFLETSMLSSRAGAGIEYATFGSYRPVRLIGLLFPGIYGNPYNADTFIKEPYLLGYVGVLPLVLSLVSIKKRNRIRIFFLVAAVFSLLFAMGKYSIVHTVTSTLLPFLTYFRMPMQILIFWTFSIAVLAGFGIHDIQVLRKNTLLYGAVLSAGLVSVSCIVFLIPAILSVDTALLFPFWQKAEFFFKYRDFLSLSLLLHGLTIGITAYMIVRYKTRSIAASIVIAAAVFSELFFITSSNVKTIPYRQAMAFVQSPPGNLLKDSVDSGYKIFVDPRLYTSSMETLSSDYLISATLRQFILLKPNTLMLSHAYTPDGYASMVHREYNSWFTAPSSDPTGVNISYEDRDNLALCGTRYIVSVSDSGIAQHLQFREPEKGAGVYEIESAKQFISLIPHSADSDNMDILSQTPGEIVVETYSEGAKMLTIMQNIYPGWRAFIDGNTSEIKPYAGRFISVSVPPGRHTVRVSYVPGSVVYGFFITMLSVVILSAAWIAKLTGITYGRMFFLRQKEGKTRWHPY